MDDLKQHLRAAAESGNAVRVGETLWNRYEITERLGTGKSGEVWRCRDLEAGGEERTLRKLDKAVRKASNVLKGLHTAILKADPGRMPGLAAVRQIIYVKLDVYVLADYVEGRPLEAWLEEKPRTQEEILGVFEQVAAALDLAHSRGILHGELSAADVLVDPEGRAWVTDFGLRPERGPGGVMPLVAREEPEWLAPEQKGWRAGDAASDQYMLGETIRRVMERHGGEWSRAAREAVKRATSRKPHRRFAECADVIRSMRGEAVTRGRKRTEAELKAIRTRLLWAAAVAATAGIVAVGGWLAVQFANLPDEPDEAGGAADGGEEAPAKVVRARQTDFEPLKVTKEEPTPGYPWRTASTGMELLWIDEMQMWVGRFEVTNEEYRKKKPDHASDPFCSPKGTKKLPLNSGRQPVVYVNFADALEYAAWLTEQERAAGKLPEGWAYRLPGADEAVAYIRAGAEGTYPWGNEMPPRYGNYADESLKEAFFDMPTIQGYRDGAACTAWVEASGQNAWGLYGASGNVWEIASRRPGETVFGGWFGASWDDHDPKRLVPESRYGFFGDARGAVNGFRLVLAPVAGAGAE